MKKALNVIKKQPWQPFILISLTLGLAPFTPPHVYEKSIMLFKGELVKAIDLFDFFLHGTPWLLLSLKVFSHFAVKNL